MATHEARASEGYPNRAAKAAPPLEEYLSRRLTSRSTAQRSEEPRPSISSPRRPLFRKLAECSPHTPAQLRQRSRASAETHPWLGLLYAYHVTREQPGESQHSRSRVRGPRGFVRGPGSLGLGRSRETPSGVGNARHVALGFQPPRIEDLVSGPRGWRDRDSATPRTIGQVRRN
jgi:hypothetical protein